MDKATFQAVLRYYMWVTGSLINPPANARSGS
jgi:hypothetical protein